MTTWSRVNESPNLVQYEQNFHICMSEKKKQTTIFMHREIS